MRKPHHRLGWITFVTSDSDNTIRLVSWKAKRGTARENPERLAADLEVEWLLATTSPSGERIDGLDDLDVIGALAPSTGIDRGKIEWVIDEIGRMPADERAAIFKTASPEAEVIIQKTIDPYLGERGT